MEAYVFMTGAKGLGYYGDGAADRAAAARALARATRTNIALAELLRKEVLVRLSSTNVGLRNPLLPYFRVYVAPPALLRHAFDHFHIPISLANEAKALAHCAVWLHSQVARVDAAVAALPALPDALPDALPEIVLPTRYAKRMYRYILYESY